MVRESWSSGMEDAGGVVNMTNNMNMKPAWLEGLMAETFFGGCGVHENRRKNEKNVFACAVVLVFAPTASLLTALTLFSRELAQFLKIFVNCQYFQVRRYVYHDVVRLGDLEKLIDCSSIQPYTINSAKVIFLNQRPQSRSSKGSANICFTCDRILQEPFNFCSLSCKVDHMVYRGEYLSGILYRYDESDFAISEFEGLRMDGSSEIIDDDGILEDQDHSLQYRSGSSCSNEATSNSVIPREPEVVKKKKKGGFLPGIVLSLSSRRKELLRGLLFLKMFGNFKR